MIRIMICPCNGCAICSLIWPWYPNGHNQLFVRAKMDELFEVIDLALN